MRQHLFFVLGVLLAVSPGLTEPVLAQGTPGSSIVVANCGTPPTTYTPGQNKANLQDATGKQCVSSTASVTLQGFLATAGATASLPTSTISADVALPAGTAMTVTNPSNSVTAYFRYQVGAGTAVTTDWTILPGQTVGFSVGTATHISAITASGSTTLAIQGGSGFAAGYGGGGGGGGGGTTNLTGVNSVTPLTNVGVSGAGSLRTTQAQDTSTIAGADPATTGIYVTGPSAAALGTAANQAAIQGSKTGGTAATNSVLTGGVYNSLAPSLTNGQQAATQMDSSGNLKVNVVAGAAGGTAYAQGSTTSGQNVSPMGCRTLTSLPTDTTAQTNMPVCTTSGELASHDATLITAAQAGTATTLTSAPASAIYVGGRATTAHPTAATDGQIAPVMTSTEGKLVVDPFAPSAFRVSGTATSTDTSAHTLIAAGAGSLKNYITGVQCGRTDAGTSPILITFSDAQSMKMVIPNAGNGGGNNFNLASPWVTAAATAFTFTSGTGTTSVYCNAEGYQAP